MIKERLLQQAPDGLAIAESLTVPERFAEIIDAYSGRVFDYLARRVGPAAAEDLAAETFLRAFRSRATYKELRPTALPWLYGIATNLLRDHASSERRRLETLSNLAAGAVFRTPREDLDSAAEAALAFQNLGGALATLSAEARDVVALVAVEGLSYEEAAVALGLPVGTVRSRLSRARRDLRFALHRAGRAAPGLRSALQPERRRADG
ncbi:MAG TPA: RNA polymerase sigma factor [Acidimicrobiales bacterium]|nr:RNA polymerase sigma factor [Acidimicrobiales bacterium]